MQENGQEIKASRPNSHDFEYVEGDFKYIDTYLGGEQFSGEEGLWKDDIPLWSMNYAGRVLDEGFSGKFLKEVLSLVLKIIHIVDQLFMKMGSINIIALSMENLSGFKAMRKFILIIIKFMNVIFMVE